METFKELFKKKFLCCHDWELWKELRILGDYDECRYHIYHFKCNKCGKFKKVKSS